MNEREALARQIELGSCAFILNDEARRLVIAALRGGQNGVASGESTPTGAPVERKAPAAPPTAGAETPKFPRCPSAFINAIADEGDKNEAIEWLQRTWDELCHTKRELSKARHETALECELIACANLDRPIEIPYAIRAYADTLQSSSADGESR